LPANLEHRPVTLKCRVRSRIFYAVSKQKRELTTEHRESSGGTCRMTQRLRGRRNILQNNLFYGADRGNSKARVQGVSAWPTSCCRYGRFCCRLRRTTTTCSGRRASTAKVPMEIVECKSVAAACSGCRRRRRSRFHRRRHRQCGDRASGRVGARAGQTAVPGAARGTGRRHRAARDRCGGGKAGAARRGAAADRAVDAGADAEPRPGRRTIPRPCAASCAKFSARRVFPST